MFADILLVGGISMGKILEMINICKSYYGNQVLTNVNLDLFPGEIHSLVGENGSGKSTLMNILFGMPVIQNTGGFEGEIIFEGTTSDYRLSQEGYGTRHRHGTPGIHAFARIHNNRKYKTKQRDH